MLKTRLALLFFIFLFILLSTNAKALIIDYNYITDDTWISKYNPTTNYGSNVELPVSGGSGNYTSYLKFNISDYFLDKNVSSLKANLSLWHRGYILNANTNLLINVFNTTLNWTEENVTYNTKPLLSTLITNLSVIENDVNIWNNYSIDSAVLSAIKAGNYIVSLAVQTSNISLTDGVGYVSKEYASTSLRPYLSIDYNITDCLSDCGNCGCKAGTSECNTPSIIGSTCDYSTISNGAIKTVPYANCTNTTFYSCPNFTYCSQITPAINVSEYLSQSSGGMLDWCRGCWFINYRPDPIFHYNNLAVFATNCYNRTTNEIYTECNCNQIGNCSSDIYEVQNITDVPYSITEWVAGCFNPSTGKYVNVTNSTGGQTTIETLINDTCPNCTLTNNTSSQCLNTSTICYDSLTCNTVPCGTIVSTTCNDNVGGQAALQIGSLMGITDCGLSMNIFSILISIIIGFMVLYYTRGSDQAGMAFIVGTLAPLTMFSLISWFPAWLIVILIVIAAYLLAKSLGVGGG